MGEWKLVKNNALPTPTLTLASTSSLFRDATMPYIEIGDPKKTVEKKEHLQVVNVLKEFIGDTNITKHILNLEVNFIVGELLVSALVVEKQLTKVITKDKTVQFWVNTLQPSRVDT